MTEDFNKWWNSDELVEDNPYGRDTPAFWAWEGWRAALKVEREACAKVCEEPWQGHPYDIAKQIRARGAP